MSLIVDTELDGLLKPPSPIVSGIRNGNLGFWNSRVQPASIDLSIGKIYLPDVQSGQPGSGKKPLTKSLLTQGQTAVIETAETLKLPSEIAAIGFPPSSVSMQGLLMTNPGHVDPGFSGTMRFTVINIAKEPFNLEAGTLICTLLFFRLQQAPSVDYEGLDRTCQPERPDLDTGLLRILSHEFMDIDARAEQKAAKAVERSDRRAMWMQIGIPIATAIIALVGSLSLTILGPLEGVKERVIRLEEASKLSSDWDATFGALEKRVKALEGQ